MKRLTVVAAAFAAGMGTFAAYAQDKPIENPKNLTDRAASKAGQPTKQAELKKGAAQKCLYLSGCKTDWQALEKAHSPSAHAAVAAAARKVAEGLAAITPGDAPGTGSYHSIIARYATSYGVPLALAQAVVQVESNFRPDARGRAGEIGLMQIKHATARLMGYAGTAEGLFDPETNIRFGMRYLAKAHALGGGSTCGTILKYNAGHAAKRMNPVSEAYCSKVKRQLAGL